MFEQLLTELKTTRVTSLAGKAWFDRLYVRNFGAFFHCLAKLLRIIDDAHATCNRDADNDRLLSSNQVKRLYDVLYDTAMASIRYLSPGMPGASDEYEECPLVVIYVGAATCVDFLRTYFPVDTDDYYPRRLCDVPYCVQHGLNVTGDAEVRSFSMQELLNALTQLEQSAHTLTYDDALVYYVDALDARVCDFLLYAMPDVAHNVADYRVMVGRGLYTCSTAVEYQLVVMILAARQLVESAAPLWRVDAEMAPVEYPEDEAVLVETIQAKFIAEIQNVHSDDIEDKFYKAYTQQSIVNSEGYLFLKANPMTSRIEPGVIIRQFRNIPQWRRITETAARSVTDFLFDPLSDFLAFKIAFSLAANLIFDQTLRVSWFEHATDGDRVRVMDGSESQIFVEESYKAPVVLVLLNDACVLFRGRLTIFGRRHVDHYRAFLHWLFIIQHELNGNYCKCRPIAPLVDALFTETQHAPPPRPAASYTARDFRTAEGDESLCIEPSRIIAELQVEERKWKAPPPLSFKPRATPASIFAERSRVRHEYEHIMSRIETRPQELDASSIVGDTDETGFPRTTRSAWSLV